MEWGHEVVENRVGKNGIYAEVGDVVRVFKGRKYPLDLKFIVADIGFANYNGHPGWHDEKELVFYDWNGKNYINPENVVIVAKREDRDSDPEYRDVHKIEVCF